MLSIGLFLLLRQLPLSLCLCISFPFSYSLALCPFVPFVLFFFSLYRRGEKENMGYQSCSVLLYFCPSVSQSLSLPLGFLIYFFLNTSIRLYRSHSGCLCLFIPLCLSLSFFFLHLSLESVSVSRFSQIYI